MIPPAAVLDACAALVGGLLGASQPAEAVVADFFRGQRSLGPRERAVVADTAYAVLRRRRLFEALATGDAAPLPAPALARRLALLGFAGPRDALARGLREGEAAWLAASEARIRGAAWQALPEPLRHNLPDWLAARLQAQWGEAFWPLVAALEQPAPLDLRVNTVHAKRESVQAQLAAAGIASAPTPHSPWGLRLVGKPALGKVAPFARGLVEVQDEGSQLLALLTDAQRGELVVDFCAGAGGKSLALGAAMRGTGRLYALDTSAHRLAALKPRLEKSGLSNVFAQAIAHERDERVARLTAKADRVLVDAPCSGLGTLRRHPDLKWRQTEAAVAAMAGPQAAILASAARLVKPGGRLVYATCSLLSEENEAIAQAFSQSAAGTGFAPVAATAALARHKLPDADALCGSDGQFLRLAPHRQGTDGFFAAVWQRQP